MSPAASVMVRRSSMDTSCAAPALPGRPVFAALALALALTLAFGAGEAAAQTCNSARTVTAATPFSTFNSNTDLTRTFANVRIETTGGVNAFAAHAYHGGNGDIDFDMRDFTLSTSGRISGAVLVSRPFRAARNTGDVEVDLQCGSIVTSGSGSYGAEATNFDGGDIAVDVKKVNITTSGDNARGLHFNRAQSSGSDYATQGVKDGEVTVEIGDSTIETSGANAHAVWISQDRAVTGGGAGGIDADLTNVAISTSGAGAIGVRVFHRDTTGAVALDVTGGSVSTSGAGAHAVLVDRAGTGNAAITLAGVAIAAEGRGAGGVRAFHGGSGSVTLTVGAGTKVEAPFAIGVDARLTDGANAAGRLVVTHGGTVEARDAGIVAWAARRSGHTSGAGANEADDAARTEPMIHVTSSGNVTVGEGVRDAFIRAAIAGEDGMLSAGEKAVFDAIVAEDSSALTTALAALPASYDAAWKARANALSDSRSYEPDAGVLANRAAEEILGLTRSGIRALALSHEAIAGHVRNGDGDGALSAAERTALAAALTGGDLETALSALSATYTDAWKDTLREMAASYNAGDVRVEVTGGAITAEGDGVDARYALSHDENGAIAVSVAAGASVTGGRHGVHVGGAGLVTGNADLRDQTVTVDGVVMGGTGAGVHLAGGGTVVVGSNGRVGATSGDDGILSEGAGDLVATVHGTVEGDIRAEGGGDLSATVAGTVKGDVVEEGAGDLDATISGTVEGDVFGRGTGEHTVTVSRGGTVEGDIRAEGGGDLSATVAGTVKGDVVEEGAGDLDATISGTVEGDVFGRGTGEHTVTVSNGGTVTGTIHLAASTVTVDGTAGRVQFDNGGTVTVGSAGKLTGVEAEGGREAIRSEAGDLTLTLAGMVTGDVRGLGDGDLDATVAGTVRGDLIEEGAGDLSATVTGRVEGDVRAEGGGDLTVDVQEGGVVTGTVHDPAGPLTVAGSIGRLLYASGGTVTVAATGRITGVEGEETDGIHSAGGDLSVTVAGTVTGDLRAPSGGALTLAVMEGGSVTGTVHDPAGPLTVHGSMGRLLYSAGGAVTVAATGRITGIEGETDGIRSEAGDLSVTVAGAVAGDVRAKGGGALTLAVMEGGSVTGTVHDPAGPLTIHGSVGRLLYSAGGAVTVAATGKLTGVEVEGGREAIRSEAGDLTLSLAGMVTGDVRGPGDGDLNAMVAGTVTGDVIEEGAGDLDATISGTVEGDVFGRGTGEHTVTVSDGGTVTGTIHLAASTVTVDGTAGRVRFDNGGMVTVGSAGKLTGVAVEGGTEAIRSEAGDLIATISGMVEGDVFGRGAGANRVTVSDGGTMRGTIDLAKGTVAVDGTAGRVRFDEGGEVVVSGTGRITGIEVEDGREAIRSEAGDLKVTLQARAGEADEEAAKRINGDIDSPNPVEFCYAPAGEAPKCGSDGVVQLGDGAELRLGDGGVTFGSAQWIRMMYGALPSALLGLNGLAGFEERMAAPRTEGGGWARMEAFKGKWKADASTTPGLEYDRRRQGLRVGMDVPVAEDGLFGVSLHHRRGAADVSGGGEIDLSGNGGGVSGTWRGDDVYVDLQAEATWYEADFTSSRRGALKKDVSARGHALGMEVGRWFAMDGVLGGSVLTPRAALAHSKVSVDGFTDEVGSRVSVESGRSLMGRLGVSLEARPNEGSRVSGSLDVEHEFSDDQKVRVSGTPLTSEAEATRVRLGLNGSRASDDGRWTLAGGMSYATSGGSHEVGGRVNLKVRF